MTQSFLQPKGMLKPQIGIEDLTKQYAQIFSKPQAQEQTESTNPMRQTLNDYFTKIMANQITMPKYTTLSDVLGANKGDKLGVFADFLKNPQTMRTIGGLLPKYGYNPQTGKMGNVMEEPARREEALMQAEQEKALQQMKEQNDIATALNHTYMQQDIANEQNKLRRELAEQEQKWRTEEAEKDRAFRRGENAANRANSLAISRLVHGGGGGGGSSSSGGSGTVTGGAAGLNLNNIKMTAADRKSLTENKTTLANIEAGLKSLDANPKAYSFLKGIMGPDVTNRLDPKGVATRTQIDNITAVYRKWLTGAQMSDKERKAYESSD